MSSQQNQMTAEEAQEILRLANILYFRKGLFEKTHWMGKVAAKNPMDLWVFQELINSLDTDLLIETGTYKGGSALFFAQIFEILGRGKVLSIDIQPGEDLPTHSRIEYLQGSSTSDAVLERANELASKASSVLVILDSDHTYDYKLEEMRRYAQLVTVGSYLVAEDTCFDAYPAWPEFGKGPAHAVKQFLSERKDFEVDRGMERHMITFTPMGYLKRLK